MTTPSVERFTGRDGSGRSVLETLGQTQSTGDDGDDEGCEECPLALKQIKLI